MKIAIQGFEASFHSIAAKSLYGNSAELLFCKNFKEVFSSLENNNCDQAVVAIENSLYGSINQVYDLLIKHDLSITGEVYEQVGLHLLAAKGANLHSITDVYSQAPALGESEVFLDTYLPDAERHEHPDTALAAKEVAAWGLSTHAAIASEAAASYYHLEVISRSIETHHQNYTRFISLSKTNKVGNAANKTSLTFRTADTPGSLYAVLGLFANHSINLTKLESRPIIGEAWRYMYYIDFNQGVTHINTKQVLNELPKYATEIRILGSYQAGIFEKS